jgi:hypothetical protein
VFEILVTLAQFIYILWPLFLISAFIYSLWGYTGIAALFNRNRRRHVLRRVQLNLLYTWLMVFVVWLFSLFADGPTPTLLPEPYNGMIFFGGLALLLINEIYRLRLFPLRLRARIDLHEIEQIAYLKEMDPAHFEELVAETYRALGYSAQRTGKSGDHGVDVLVFTPAGKRWIVQCKRYRDTVGESVVRELYGTLMSERADRAVLVTSANITAPAVEWARGKPIALVDGPALLRLIEQARSKAKGSPFDRLTRWIEGLVGIPSRPPGLRAPRPLPAAVQPQPAAQEPSAAISASTRQTAPFNMHGNGRASIELAQLEQSAAAARLPSPQPSADQGSVEKTQPSRVRITRPPASRPPAVSAPICPRCGASMVTHPRSDASRPGRQLLRCSTYPTCRAVIEQ